MNYLIKNSVGKKINYIVAAPGFIDEYCKQHEYQYELMPEPKPLPPVLPTLEERFAQLEQEVSGLAKTVQKLELTAGGSVLEPDKPPVDNPPEDKPPKPSGGLTIGG